MAAADVMDADVVRRWLLLAADALGQTRAAIDQLNVFPVPDADTGTNLHATMAGAAAALATLPPAASVTEIWQAAVQAALRDACGNSGIILSQLLRGLADTCAPAAPCDGAVMAAALASAAVAARAAVWRPAEGMLLTVAEAAAQAALRSAGLAAVPAQAVVAGQPGLAEVCRAAALGARQALALTERQHEVLASNGVVDAGGAGLCVVLDALCAAIDDAPPGGYQVPPPRPRPAEQPDPGSSPHGYEVTFLIEAGQDAIAALAARLDALGDSLVISGSDPRRHVHVHASDPGAVIEAALAFASPAKIKITFLNGPRHRVAPLHRDESWRRGHNGAPAGQVAVIAEGAGLARLLRAAGAIVVPAGPAGAVELAMLAVAAEPRTLIAPAAFAGRWPSGWPFVEAVCVIQAIAALAVHDPGRAADTDAVAMRRAAAGMRWDSVPDEDGLLAAAVAAAGRLTTKETELITILTGQAAAPGLAERLTARLRAAAPAAEVICYDGGMTDAALLIGAE